MSTVWVSKIRFRRSIGTTNTSATNTHDVAQGEIEIEIEIVTAIR